MSVLAPSQAKDQSVVLLPGFHKPTVLKSPGWPGTQIHLPWLKVHVTTPATVHLQVGTISDKVWESGREPQPKPLLCPQQSREQC